MTLDPTIPNRSFEHLADIRARLATGRFPVHERRAVASFIVKDFAIGDEISIPERAAVLRALFDSEMDLKINRLLPLLNSALQRADYQPVLEILLSIPCALDYLSKPAYSLPTWMKILASPAGVAAYLAAVPLDARPAPIPGVGGVLHWAIKAGDTGAKLAVLLEDPWGRSHARCEGEQGMTAFETATKSRNPSLVQAFLAHLPEVLPQRDPAENLKQFLRRVNLAWLPPSAHLSVQCISELGIMEREVGSGSGSPRSRL